MTAQRRTALYSPDMLALAVELAEYPYNANAAFSGDARSRTCGSTVRLSCMLDARQRLSGLGLKVSACAVGQAAAAVFARHAAGQSADDLSKTAVDLQTWLSGEGKLPEWPRFEMLAPALPHTGRHEAILLPWRAALDALSKREAAR